MLNTRLSIPNQLSITRFHFYCSMKYVVLLYLPTISSGLLYTFFWYHSHMLVNLVLQGSNKYLSNNRVSIVVHRIHFNATVMKRWFHCYPGLCLFMVHVLLGLWLDSSKFFWNALVIAISFFFSIEQAMRTCCKYQQHGARIWPPYCIRLLATCL